MKTYDERLVNIYAKADANIKAHRAIAMALSTLAILALTVCAFLFLPIFDSNASPTEGPALYQPADTQNTPDPILTHPSDTVLPDETMPYFTIPNIPQATQPMPTAPQPTMPEDPSEVPAGSDLTGSAFIKVSVGGDAGLAPVVIRSIEELSDFCDQYDQEMIDFENVRSQAAKYADSFFEGNSLILLMKPEGSGSNRLSLLDVRFSDDGSVQLRFERWLPESGTCDMAYWYIFIEVAATDIAEDQISVEYTTIWSVEDVDFTVKTGVVGYHDPEIAVIRSVEELLAYCSSDSIRNCTAEYDDAFFESNTLILLCRYESSGGNVNQVTDVIRMSDGSIRINVNRWPYGMTCDMAVWSAAVTIPEVLPEDTVVKADYTVVQNKPVTYTNLSFTATYESGPGVEELLDGKQIILRSVEDMEEAFGANSDIYPKYDAAFFAEKTLVIYYRSEFSGMARHEVTEVRQGDDGRYRIILNAIYPEFYTEDMGHGIIYIELDAKLPEDAILGVLVDYRVITNEQWQQLYGYEEGIAHE